MIFDIGSRVTVTNINDGTNYIEANGTIVGWHDIGRGATQAVVVLDNSERIVIPLSNLDEVR